MQTNHRTSVVGLFLALAPLAFTATAQDRQARDLAGFESVSIGGGLDLFLRQGERFVVEVESSEPSEIVTEIRGGTLDVRRERSFFDFFDWGDHGAVHVTMPALVALTASGGSDVRTEGSFSGNALRLDASGGSDVAIDVAVGELELQASGGSDVSLTGSARTAHVQSSGGSDVDASRFTTDEANVESSGGSDLSIAVRERIVGHASGGSDITYSGEPRSADVDTSGGGDVTHR